jgi:protein SCO1/2
MTPLRTRVRAGVLGLLLSAVLGCQQPWLPLPILPIGGDFQLTDQDGQPFTLASQRGKVVLIFFGYCSCPDACPTTLSKLATVARRLGDDRTRVRTLYISVDPDRDTPAVLKADLASFSLDAVGLTGTKEQIDRVVKQYAASYEIVPTPDSAAKYTISHTTIVYGLDTQGRVRKTFSYSASVDDLVGGIRAILADPS